MCTQYLHHNHPPTSFPHIFPLPLVPTPQTGPVLPSFYWTRPLSLSHLISSLNRFCFDLLLNLKASACFVLALLPCLKFSL
jgi:hypothetical protein